jgi:hypothetical protein
MLLVSAHARRFRVASILKMNVAEAEAAVVDIRVAAVATADGDCRPCCAARADYTGATLPLRTLSYTL